jgi:glycerophosphoryl diester phosphodiesterase
MSNPFLRADLGFLRLCGHRGHNLTAPENTIAAFREAHRLGATSLEIDTVLSADRQIVVLHDLLLDRTTSGQGAANRMTLADIKLLDAGAWFDPAFAGEKVPTLAETIALAHELDLVLEVEIKEKADLPAYYEALAEVVKDPADLARVMMISFDHASLKAVKALIPGLRTGGIVHERFPDPVAVARMSDLDELCIDLDVFDPVTAADLHEAGIAIRCHAYAPRTWDKAETAGLGWPEKLSGWLQAGLIDTLSGDDVGWLRDFAARSAA